MVSFVFTNLWQHWQTHFTFFRRGMVWFQNCSLRWGMPDMQSPLSWGPCIFRKFSNISSEMFSFRSMSKEMRFLMLPLVMNELRTWSLNPSCCPALKYLKPGILVKRSIRHSVDNSVAVMSSSWRTVLSHSTAITCSCCKPVAQDEYVI